MGQDRSVDLEHGIEIRRDIYSIAQRDAGRKESTLHVITDCKTD